MNINKDRGWIEYTPELYDIYLKFVKLGLTD